MGAAISRLTSTRSTASVMKHLKPEPRPPSSMPKSPHPVHVKDEILVTRATEIMHSLESVPPKPIKAAGPLPTSRNISKYEDPEMPGRITSKAMAELIVRYQQNPEQNSVEYLAKEYNLDSASVKSVLSEFAVPVVLERPGSKEKIGQWNEPNPESKVPFTYFNELFRVKNGQTKP